MIAGKAFMSIQALHVTGAAILVLRGNTVLQAAPARELGVRRCQYYGGTA
jgi:hypothetical protein